MKFHYFNRAIPFLVSFVSAHGMLNENHYVKLFAFERIFIVMSASFVTVNRKNRRTRTAKHRARRRKPGLPTARKKAVVRKPDNRLQKIRTDDYSTIDTRSSTALSKGTLWPLRGTIFRLFGLTPNLFTSAS